jgi:hypothetical protein
MTIALAFLGLAITVMNPDGINHTWLDVHGMRGTHYGFGAVCTMEAWLHVREVDVGPDDTLYRLDVPPEVPIAPGECPAGTLFLLPSSVVHAQQEAARDRHAAAQAKERAEQERGAVLKAAVIERLKKHGQ